MTNKPEVSPAMTAEERVKKVWPEAAALDCHEIAGDYNIYSANRATAHHLGNGTSTAKAWIDAASRLPASPVAEGESQMAIETFDDWWKPQVEACEVEPSPEEEGFARAAWEAAYRNGFIDGRETGYNTCGSCEHPWYAHTGECGAYMKDGSICGCTKQIISDPEELK